MQTTKTYLIKGEMTTPEFSQWKYYVAWHLERWRPDSGWSGRWVYWRHQQTRFLFQQLLGSQAQLVTTSILQTQFS